MKTKVNDDGHICTYNEDGELHSFNGKPAIIMSNGYVVWCDKGRLVKTVCDRGETWEQREGES